MASQITPNCWESPLDALLTVSKLVNSPEANDRALRIINFMAYDLSLNTQDMCSEEKLTYINNLFFNVKGFKVQQEPYTIAEILHLKEGSAIGLALLYMHLAQTIDLKIQLVHWPQHAVLRWCTENKTRFIDLEQNGRLLSEEELLQLITQHSGQIKTLSATEGFLQYLSYISVGLRQKKQLEKILLMIHLMLDVEPNNMRFLAERALLQKDLGQYKAALADFKRYFSFVEPQLAAAEILESYNFTLEFIRSEQPAMPEV